MILPDSLYSKINKQKSETSLFTGHINAKNVFGNRGLGIYGKSLYLPLSFALNLKLHYKTNFFLTALSFRLECSGAIMAYLNSTS